jgi:hypothetical protein
METTRKDMDSEIIIPVQGLMWRRFFYPRSSETKQLFLLCPRFKVTTFDFACWDLPIFLALFSRTGREQDPTKPVLNPSVRFRNSTAQLSTAQHSTAETGLWVIDLRDTPRVSMVLIPVDHCTWVSHG